MEKIESSHGPQREIPCHTSIERRIHSAANLRSEANLDQGQKNESANRDASTPRTLRTLRTLCTLCTLCTLRTLDRDKEQHLHDDEGDDHMNRDDPRRKLVGHHASAQPALKSGQQQGGDDRPEDAWLISVMPPRGDGGGEDQKPDGDAQQSVQVLRPHQRRVELRDVELRWQIGGGGGRDPGSEAARPVGTPEPRTRCAHEAANENQDIRRGRRPQCEALK
jgi:hypothetical protein